MRKGKRVHLLMLLGLIFCLLLFTVGCPPAPEEAEEVEEEPIKVGLAMSTIRTDYSWGQGTYRGIQHVREKFPDIQFDVMDALPMAEQVPTFRKWAGEGYDLILGWGYEYLDAAVEVANEFPDVWFVITCAPEPGSEGFPPNLASAFFAEEDPGYLAGVMAALMTETNQVAYMSGTELPCGAVTINSFRQGAYDTNPEVEVHWAFVGTWADLAKERETAGALFDMGCDIIFSQWIGVAAADVAEERGLRLIGSHHLREFKPGVVLADHDANMKKAIEYILERFLDGTLEARPYIMDMEKGVTDLILTDLVPEEVKAKVEEARQKIIAGQIELVRFNRILPEQWPHEPVANYADFLEPVYEIVN